MRRLLVASVAFVSSVCAAFPAAHAETQRQRHLPYVRAASDCIANAVRRDYAFPEAVQSDDFRPLIGRAFSACRSELGRMIVAHDQIYGGGGEQFFTVDYANDIDRAVRVRLAGAITETRANLDRAAEQRAAAEAQARAVRLEAENRARAAMAEKSALARKAEDLIRDRMFACIGKEAAIMLATNETAEVVAKAAMVFCRSEVDALTQATMETIEAEAGSVGSRAVFRQQAEIAVRNLVTAHVVKARGLMSSGRSPTASDPDPVAVPPKSSY